MEVNSRDIQVHDRISQHIRRRIGGGDTEMGSLRWRRVIVVKVLITLELTYRSTSELAWMIGEEHSS